jgi:hypothetical protein
VVLVQPFLKVEWSQIVPNRGFGSTFLKG